MRKILSILILSNCLISCGLYSLITHEEVSLIQGSTKFGSSSLAIINIDIDSVSKVPFLFDTGATRTIITNDSMLAKYDNLKTVNFGKSYTPDGKKTPSRYAAVQIHTPWFSGQAKIVGLSNRTKTPCKSKSLYYGLIGLDAFSTNADCVIELCYSDSTITSKSRSGYVIPADRAFTNVNAIFKDKMFWIPLTINGATNLYLFDTGNSGGIISKYDPEIEASAQEKIVLLGSSFTSLVGSFGSETVMFEHEVAMSNLSIKSPIIIQRTGFQMYNMGIGAIRQFDWIIDFRDKQIYARKNTFSTPMPKPKRKYFHTIVGDKIQIVSLIQGNDDFKLGDEIVSVNGEQISPENICKISDLLATTDDWQTLEIKKTP